MTLYVPVPAFWECPRCATYYVAVTTDGELLYCPACDVRFCARLQIVTKAGKA